MNLLKRLKELHNNGKLNRDTILMITCIDGQIIEGRYESYTQALDNEPEVAEITIIDNSSRRLIGIFENEIKSIEIIN